MNLSRRVLAASCCAAVLFGPVPVASAYTVTPNFAEQVCQFDPNQQDSAVALFWKDLKAQAIAQRLDELDAADPGLKEAIAQYNDGRADAQDPATLQERIADTGTAEGLGMFAQNRAVEEDGIGEASGAKTDYTVSAARAAAEAIGQDPAKTTQEALQTQALKSGLRIDQITADLFAQRHAAYNDTQFALKGSLLECANALENEQNAQREAREQAKKRKAWTIAGVVIAVLAAGVALRALMNSRKPNRHHKTN